MPSQSPADSVSRADTVVSYSLVAVGHEPLKKPKTPGQDPISKEAAGFWDEALQAPSNAVRQASTQPGGEALLERRGVPSRPDSPG